MLIFNLKYNKNTRCQNIYLTHIFIQALLVNPYELETVAETIHRALQMPENEREARMNALRSKERVNNVEQWMAKFIQAISELIQEDGNNF